MKQSTLYQQLAIVLSEAYSANPDISIIDQNLPKNEADWYEFISLTIKQKSLALLSYTGTHVPIMQNVIGDEEHSAMANWNQSFGERSLLIQTQLTELKDLFTKHKMPIMLLKGAVQFYDDLYPDISVRHMSDLDLLIQNPAPFHTLIENGYDIHDHNPLFGLDGSDERLAAVLADDTLHHLPPVSRLGDQVTLECHISPIQRRLSKLLIPDLWDTAVPVASDSLFYTPSHRNQLIINIIHTLYHGKSLWDRKIKLKNLFEGRLMYLRLSETDRAHVEQHFLDRGYVSDYRLWKFICFDLFKDTEMRIKPTKRHQRYVRAFYAHAVNPRWIRTRKFTGQMIHLLTYSLFKPQSILRKIRLEIAKRIKKAP
jgi:hypothetical protein